MAYNLHILHKRKWISDKTHSEETREKAEQPGILGEPAEIFSESS